MRVIQLAVIVFCATLAGCGSAPPSASPAPAPVGVPLDTKNLANPYSSARPGDWARYASTQDSGGKRTESTLHKKIKARADDSITVTTLTKSGAEEHTSEFTMLLGDSAPHPLLTRIPGADIRETARATETLTINGKELKTTRVETTSTVIQNASKHPATTKLWFSSDAPLDGVVKLVTEANGSRTTFELQDFGRAP